MSLPDPKPEMFTSIPTTELEFLQSEVERLAARLDEEVKSRPRTRRVALEDAAKAVCAGCSGSDATAYETQPVLWQRMKLWMHTPPKGFVHPPRPCSASGIWMLLAKEGFLRD